MALGKFSCNNLRSVSMWFQNSIIQHLRKSVYLAQLGSKELGHLGGGSRGISHQLEKPGGTWLAWVPVSLRKGAFLLMQLPTLIPTSQGLGGTSFIMSPKTGQLLQLPPSFPFMTSGDAPPPFSQDPTLPTRFASQLPLPHGVPAQVK